MPLRSRIKSAVRRRFGPKLPGVVSLLDAHTASVYLEDSFEVQPFLELRSENALAIPHRLTRHLKPRYAYWLKNVWVQLEHGIIWTSTNELIAETLPSKYRLLKLLKAGAFDSKPNKTEGLQLDEPIASLGAGKWFGHYYHWLVDEMPRTIGLDLVAAARRLYVPNGYPNGLVDLIGNIVDSSVKVCRPRLNLPWAFARNYLFLPPLTADYCGYLPGSYIRKLRDATAGLPVSADSQERVYISRSGATKRRIKNESEVEGILERHGFETLRPENLSIEQQIQTFRSVGFLISAHGAGLTNMLYTQRCKIIELFPGQPHTHYRWLSESLGHPYGALAGSGHGTKHDDFEVDLARLEKLLDRFAD